VRQTFKWRNEGLVGVWLRVVRDWRECCRVGGSNGKERVKAWFGGDVYGYECAVLLCLDDRHWKRRGKKSRRTSGKVGVYILTRPCMTKSNDNDEGKCGVFSTGQDIWICCMGPPSACIKHETHAKSRQDERIYFWHFLTAYWPLAMRALQHATFFSRHIKIVGDLTRVRK